MFKEFENPECPICYLEYQRDSAQTPRVLSKCGHSLCEECLKKLIDLCRTATKSVPCPVCRQHSLTTSLHNISDFIVNYPLLSAIERISDLKSELKDLGQNFCDIHKQTLNLLCLDPHCKDKPLNCFLCIKYEHGLCQQDYQLELREAKGKLLFLPYSEFVEEFIKIFDGEIEGNKNRSCDKLNNKEFEFFSEVKSKICLLTVEDLISDRNQYLVDSKEMDLNSKIVIRPKNKDKIDNLFEGCFNLISLNAYIGIGQSFILSTIEKYFRSLDE